MKKFVVWGVAVCAAVVAQATSFLWHNDAAISNSNGVYAVGGTVYLIDGADGHGGISQSALVDKIKGGETIAWNNYTFYSATLGTDGKSFTSLMDDGAVVPLAIVSGSAIIDHPYAKVQYEVGKSSGYKSYGSGVGEQYLNSGDFYSVLVTGDGNYYFSEVVSVNVSGLSTTDVKFSNTATGAFAAGKGGWYKVQSDADDPETPGGDDPETPGGDDPETPGGDDPETPGGDDPETPGGDDPTPDPYALFEDVATIEDPVAFAATTYDGYLFRESDGALAGTIQVKAAKAKTNKKTQATTTKLTVSMQFADGTKKLSAKGEYDLVAGGEQEFAVKNRGNLALSLGANGLTGSFEGLEIVSARNVFTAKDDASKVAEIEAKWIGVVNVVGSNVALTVSIAKKGKVKVSGMVGGAKVSATSQLLVGDDGVCCVPVMITKKANLAFNLWLPPKDEDDMALDGFDGAVDTPAPLKPGAAFCIEDGGDALEEALSSVFVADGDGLLDDYLPTNLVVQIGKKWVVSPDENGKAAKAGKVVLVKNAVEVDEKKSKFTDNMSGLKFTYTEKTGTFKGSFKAYAVVKGKLKSYTVNVTGVMLGDEAHGMATLNKPAAIFPIAIKAVAAP